MTPRAPGRCALTISAYERATPRSAHSRGAGTPGSRRVAHAQPAPRGRQAMGTLRRRTTSPLAARQSNGAPAVRPLRLGRTARGRGRCHNELWYARDADLIPLRLLDAAD